MEPGGFSGVVSPESQLLLEIFWSWTGGVIAVLLLGVLLPVSLALLIGGLPLMRARRDFRALLPFTAMALVFGAAGVLALVVGPHRGPAIDFWTGLSLQIGLMAFVVALGSFLDMSIRRTRRERAQVQLLASVPLDDAPDGTVAAPGPRLRLNAIEAEYYVAEWMRAMGAIESTVTRARRDGGVDVRSAHYVAQVKHRPQDFVSVDVVRALHGVASTERRVGLVFASGRYSRDALSFARDAGVALFIFRPREGRLVGANAMAMRLQRDGLISDRKLTVDAS